MQDRSSDARYAKSVFYEHVNDIDVFIEDKSENARKLLSILLGRALGGHVSLEAIFPLGDKNQVLDRCIQEQGVKGRPRVFIVDGDFSVLGCYSYPQYDYLFSLPRYCVENYLIDYGALAELVFEEDATRDAYEIGRDLDFEGWLTHNCNLLNRLFASYATAHVLAPELRTVGNPINRMVSSGNGNLDPSKVDAVISDLRAGVDCIHGAGAFEARVEYVLATFLSGPPESQLKLVSAKDYVLPLLMMRIRSIVSLKSTNASVQIRLARRADVSDLTPISAVVGI